MTEKPRTIKSVVNTFEIITIIEERSGVTLTELATAIGLTKGTMHTYLSTLHREGYVEKSASGKYRLSLEFLHLGDHIRRQQNIYKYGTNEADKLAQKTSDVTHLAVESDGIIRMVYSNRGDPHSFKGATPSGRILPMHASATGKAILAKFPEDRVTDIVEERGLEALTTHTITSREELFEELSEVRERGYADNEQEQTIGAQTLATDIQCSDGSISGAITISGTLSQFEKKDEEELVGKLLQAANQIEINLQRGSNM